MTYTAKRWLSFYFALLLGLAILGSYNQQLYKTHRNLISHKDDLVTKRTDLSARSSKITGPVPVTTWAESHGMVRVSGLSRAGTIPQGGAPSVEPLHSKVEMYTTWR
ncbi:MAG: hypothetical protein ACRCYY_04270 [Trueperaceae bacterium]